MSNEPLFIFPAPRLFNLQAPRTLAGYSLFIADMRGGVRDKYVFGWHQEVPSENSSHRTWLEELAFADYDLYPNPRARVTMHFDGHDAQFTETHWLDADGTVTKSIRTAVPYVSRIDPMEEVTHYTPGFYRLGISAGQRPLFMAAKYITGPESRHL